MSGTRIEILEDRDDRSTFVAYINIGRLPKKKAKEYIKETKKTLEESLQIDKKTRFLVILAIADQEYASAISVVSEPEVEELEDGEIIFACGACEDEISIGIGQSYRRHLVNVEKMLELKCPNCGEKGDWKLLNVKY